MPFSFFIKRIVKIAANIIYPTECVGCGRSNSFLCSDCLGKIKIFPIQICHYCGKPSAFGQTCDDCKNSNRLDGLFVISPYDQPILKDAIHIFHPRHRVQKGHEQENSKEPVDSVKENGTLESGLGL